MKIEPIPVTFLVGFLGAGKTTLLNRLLSQASGPPIAVVVNEFGDAGIDGSLVVGGREELIELDGGCLCCTVRGDLSRTLRNLAARHRRSGGWRLGRRLAFERVVIEASGLASPGPAVQTLTLDEQLASFYRNAGVVALAGVPSIVDQLERFPEAAEQLAYADLVVETHVDRADAATRQAARAAIVSVAPSALRAAALHGDLAADTIFDLDPSPEDLAMRIERAGNCNQHDHGPDGACVTASHSSGIRALCLRAEQALRRETFEMWLRFLAQSRRAEVLRIKGCVALEGQVQATLVQGVHQLLEITPMEQGAPRESVLVVIGRDLDKDELERGWRNCWC